MNSLRLFLFLLTGGAFLASPCFGADPQKNKDLQAAPSSRVAIIYKTDLARHQLIRLLEARLSSAWELVEREDIGKVLDEQKLAVLFNAGALNDRQSLGRLLHADLLILIAVSPKNDLRIVLSETRHGFKLSNLEWASPEVNESLLQFVESELLQAARKTADPMLSIFAVPPFVSRDVTSRNDQYQKMFARLVETMLLKIPGVLVVDLEDAREVSLEKDLAGGDIQRPIPFYIFGEYRFDQNNPAAPPFVKISLTQHDEIIQEKTTNRISLEATPAFLRDTVSEMIRQVVKNSIPPPDPVAEIKWLNERASQLYEIGQYREAADVFESSLLLDPQQTDIHQMAMVAYGRCSRAEIVGPIRYRYDREHVFRALGYADLAMEHMENFLRRAEISENYSHIAGAISEGFYDLNYVRSDDSEVMLKLYEHRQRLRSAYLQLMRARQKEGRLTAPFMDMIFTRCIGGGHEFYNETLAANLQQRMEFIPLIKDPALRKSRNYAQDLVCYGLPEHMKDTPQYVGFLDLLEKEGEPFRTAVELERRKLGKIIPYTRDPKALPAPDVAAGHSIKNENYNQRVPAQEFKPAWMFISPAQNVPHAAAHSPLFIPLQFYSDKAGRSPQGFKVVGVLKCANSGDLLWGINESAGYDQNRQLYIMKERGVLKKLISLDCDHNFGQAAFDGKLAWIPVTGVRSRILVIDPETEKIIEFSESDGLPTPMSRAVTAPAGDSSVFLSGAIFREAGSRAFLAALRIDADGSKKIRLIHEARRQIRTDRSLTEERLSPDLEYQPKFMIAKPRYTPDSWDVVIARSLPGAWGLDSVLHVETQEQKATVAKASVESHITGSNVFYKDNNAYWIANGTIRCLSLEDSFVTASNASTFPEAGSSPEKGGSVFYSKGRWYVVGKALWVADGGLSGPWRKLGTSVPVQHAYQEVFDSNNCGIMLNADIRGEWKLFQIDAPE